MKVTLKHLYISPAHNFVGRHGKNALDFPIEEVESIDCVAGSGIRGDRYFDHKADYKGQLTFFDWAVYERVQSEVVKESLHPGAFRRNVIVEGVNLNDLIGKSFELDGVEFTGSEECRPCYWMDEACAPGTNQFLTGQGGLRARIVNGGKLFQGESELRILDAEK